MTYSGILLQSTLRDIYYLFYLKNDNNITIQVIDEYMFDNDNKDRTYNVSINYDYLSLIRDKYLYKLYSLSKFLSKYKNDVLEIDVIWRDIYITNKKNYINVKNNYFNNIQNFIKYQYYPNNKLINNLTSCILDKISNNLYNTEIIIDKLFYKYKIMLIIINLKKKLNNNCIDCILQYLL